MRSIVVSLIALSLLSAGWLAFMLHGHQMLACDFAFGYLQEEFREAGLDAVASRRMGSIVCRTYTRIVRAGLLLTALPMLAINLAWGIVGLIRLRRPAGRSREGWAVDS